MSDRPPPGGISVRLSAACLLAPVLWSCSESSAEPEPSGPSVHSLSVQITGAGEGQVTSSPAGIACRTGGSGPCQADFQAGTQVTLTAAPDTDFAFGGWAGATDEPELALTMDRARSVSAAFIVPPPVDRHVPGDFATVQEAIEASRDGDHVVLAPGVYVGTFDLAGRRLTLRSTDPSDPDVVASTILDGAGEGPVLTIANGEHDAAVRGLTIRNGRAHFGGGLFVSGVYPVVADNVFRDNFATEGGGGMAIVGGPAAAAARATPRARGAGGAAAYDGPGIHRNAFFGNGTDGDGGGFLGRGVSPLTIRDGIFEGNEAGGRGGGARIEPDPDATDEEEVINAFIDIRDTFFGFNFAKEEGGGLSLSGAGGQARIEDVSFVGNGTEGDGGGLSFSLFVTDAIQFSDRFDFSLGIRYDRNDDNHAGRNGGGANLRGAVAAEIEGPSSGNVAGRYGGGVFAAPRPDATEAELAAGFLRILHGEFDRNEAGWSGGGLYAARPAGFEVRSSTFTGNQAPGEGGGIWVSAGPNTSSVEVSDVILSDNSAGAFGGAFYAGVLAMGPADAPPGGPWTLRDAILEANLAPRGSALHLRGPEFGDPPGDAELPVLFRMEGENVIRNNTASDSDGAAVSTEGNVAFQNDEGELDARVIGNNVLVGNQPRDFRSEAVYVRWDYTLDDGLFTYPATSLFREYGRPVAGSTSTLNFVRFGVVAPAESGCDHFHLHGPQGIDFLGFREGESERSFHGRFNDLFPSNCGFGKVYGGPFGDEPLGG